MAKDGIGEVCWSDSRSFGLFGQPIERVLSLTLGQIHLYRMAIRSYSPAECSCANQYFNGMPISGHRLDKMLMLGRQTNRQVGPSSWSAIRLLLLAGIFVLVPLTKYRMTSKQRKRGAHARTTPTFYHRATRNHSRFVDGLVVGIPNQVISSECSLDPKYKAVSWCYKNKIEKLDSALIRDGSINSPVSFRFRGREICKVNFDHVSTLFGVTPISQS